MPAFKDVILLNGTSSSGKSSLARALQMRAQAPLLHIALDTFTDMFLWDAIADPATRHRCHTAGVEHFHAALALFAKSPFGMVVDHLLLTPAWHRATRTALAGRRIAFIGVRCPLKVIIGRERARPDRQPGMAASQYERVHKHMTYDFEVDTSTASPEVCAGQVLDFIRSRPSTTP